MLLKLHIKHFPVSSHSQNTLGVIKEQTKLKFFKSQKQREKNVSFCRKGLLFYSITIWNNPQRLRETMQSKF